MKELPGMRIDLRAFQEVLRTRYGCRTGARFP